MWLVTVLFQRTRENKMEISLYATFPLPAMSLLPSLSVTEWPQMSIKNFVPCLRAAVPCSPWSPLL